MNNPQLARALGISLIPTALMILILGFLVDGLINIGGPVIVLLVSFAATLGIQRYWPHYGMWKVVWMVLGIQIFLWATVATMVISFFLAKPQHNPEPHPQQKIVTTIQN